MHSKNMNIVGRVVFNAVRVVLCAIDPLVGNDSVNTLQREPTRATVGLLLLGNGSVNTPKTVRDKRRRCFPWIRPETI
jgi:hypothetical protein